MPYPPPVRFEALFPRLEARVESYGVDVDLLDFDPPFTGDLTGDQVLIDPDESAESKCFLVLHLFGHLVQWNLHPDLIDEIGVTAVPVGEEKIAAVERYELEACRYGAGLLAKEADGEDFAQWFADYAACDLAYLAHYYRTAEKRPFEEFWQEGSGAVEPLAVPEFTPKRFRDGRAGVVL